MTHRVSRLCTLNTRVMVNDFVASLVLRLAAQQRLLPVWPDFEVRVLDFDPGDGGMLVADVARPRQRGRGIHGVQPSPQWVKLRVWTLRL
jgi:hypothetical protein